MILLPSHHRDSSSPKQQLKSSSTIGGRSSSGNSMTSPTTSSSTSRADEMEALSSEFAPSENDVVCAKGKQAKQHPGNVFLTTLIRTHLDEYSAASTKLEKSFVVSKIMKQISNAGGMFVRNVKDQWYDIGSRNAREKVGQAFRDLLFEQYRSSTRAKASTRKKRESSTSSHEAGMGACTSPDVDSSVSPPKRKKHQNQNNSIDKKDPNSSNNMMSPTTTTPLRNLTFERAQRQIQEIADAAANRSNASRAMLHQSLSLSSLTPPAYQFQSQSQSSPQIRLAQSLPENCFSASQPAAGLRRFSFSSMDPDVTYSARPFSPTPLRDDGVTTTAVQPNIMLNDIEPLPFDDTMAQPPQVSSSSSFHNSNNNNSFEAIMNNMLNNQLQQQHQQHQQQHSQLFSSFPLFSTTTNTTPRTISNTPNTNTSSSSSVTAASTASSNALMMMAASSRLNTNATTNTNNTSAIISSNNNSNGVDATSNTSEIVTTPAGNGGGGGNLHSTFIAGSQNVTLPSLLSSFHATFSTTMNNNNNDTDGRSSNNNVEESQSQGKN